MIFGITWGTEREGVSRHQQSMKVDLSKTDCKLTADERGGGQSIRISQSPMRGSGKFCCDTT